MADSSPTKWHLAHTSWFFEEFVLVPFAASYRPFDESYPYLFNSYYQQLGPMHPRPDRGLLTRPSLADVQAYRSHVDEQVERLLEAGIEQVLALIELGCHHEQQHQELILTDIKHALSRNPLLPAYSAPSLPPPEIEPCSSWIKVEEGIYEVGHVDPGFCFDNERPRHRVLLESFRVSSGAVTNGEYLDFIDSGGYESAACWLSDGWRTVVDEQWEAPLYWNRVDGAWEEFTLAGQRPLDLDAPVAHLSYYEADAFARWCGKRLPTEFEWEVVAAEQPTTGNFAEWERLHPSTQAPDQSGLFGDVWE
jgi:ergothioneine biosynthesis protein EgtB